MLKQVVSALEVPWWGDRLSLSISIGGTTVRDGDTPELLMSRSEQALLSSLREGGDCITIF
jgi:hypothetical protein